MNNETNKQIMLYAVSLLTALILLVLGIGCASTTGNSATEPAPGSEIRIYEVFGMDCPGCHGALEKLVNKIPDVLDSEANWKEKRVSVTVKAGTELNDEEIYDAIKRANFTPGKRLE